MTDVLHSEEGDIIYTADGDPIYLTSNPAICSLDRTGEDSELCPLNEEDV